MYGMVNSALEALNKTPWQDERVDRAEKAIVAMYLVGEAGGDVLPEAARLSQQPRIAPRVRNRVNWLLFKLGPESYSRLPALRTNAASAPLLERP